MVPDADTEIRHGTKIGRFVVSGELGKGGMGVVYRAHDPELDRQVALKVLRSSAATEEERMRMLREGQAMARVTHPNVITVYEVGVAGAVVFLAQELMDGGTLRSWIEKHPPREAILEKFVAAGRGLAAAHAAGLVHRDFKPENVLLGTDGRVRVADFGLARALDTDEAMPAETRANIARAQRELSTSPMSPLTRTGAVMGTPIFMAPEQHLGERADERSDQFAFCVALYHALYGAWPYPGSTAEAVANAVIKGRLAEPPRGSDVPARLRQILVRGLATNSANRFPSMEALLAELTRPPSRIGKRVAIAAGGLLLAGGAVVGGYALRQGDPPPRAPVAVASFDAQALTNERGVTWLVTALERGQLDDAAEKYAMASALAQNAAAPAQAAIAHASGALVLALRGNLEAARAKLALAAPGPDAIAKAYVELATTAISLAAGKLDAALEHGAACITGFTPGVPPLAALCAELRGDAMAATGEIARARSIYGEALAKAKKGGDHTRWASSSRSPRSTSTRKARGRRPAAATLRRPQASSARPAPARLDPPRSRPRPGRVAAGPRGSRPREAHHDPRAVPYPHRAGSRWARPTRFSEIPTRASRASMRPGTRPRSRASRASRSPPPRAHGGDGHARAAGGRRPARGLDQGRARPRLHPDRQAGHDDRTTVIRATVRADARLFAVRHGSSRRAAVPAPAHRRAARQAHD